MSGNERPIPIGKPYFIATTGKWYQRTDHGPVEVERPRMASRSDVTHSPPASRIDC